jgi:hypothetical protein
MHTLFQSLTVIPPAFQAIFNAAALAILAIFALASLGRMSIWLRGEDKDSGPIASCGRASLTKCLAGSWSSPS